MLASIVLVPMFSGPHVARQHTSHFTSLVTTGLANSVLQHFLTDLFDLCSSTSSSAQMLAMT